MSFSLWPRGRLLVYLLAWLDKYLAVGIAYILACAASSRLHQDPSSPGYRLAYRHLGAAGIRPNPRTREAICCFADRAQAQRRAPTPVLRCHQGWQLVAEMRKPRWQPQSNDQSLEAQPGLFRPEETFPRGSRRLSLHMRARISLDGNSPNHSTKPRPRLGLPGPGCGHRESA